MDVDQDAKNKASSVAPDSGLADRGWLISMGKPHSATDWNGHNFCLGSNTDLFGDECARIDFQGSYDLDAP